MMITQTDEWFGAYIKSLDMAHENNTANRDEWIYECNKRTPIVTKIKQVIQEELKKRGDFPKGGAINEQMTFSENMGRPADDLFLYNLGENIESFIRTRVTTGVWRFIMPSEKGFKIDVKFRVSKHHYYVFIEVNIVRKQ